MPPSSIQIVGLGLNGVFELVRETRSQYPELCVKALRSLLDMLQGQQPEGMKKEPPDVVGKNSCQFIVLILLYKIIKHVFYSNL